MGLRDWLFPKRIDFVARLKEQAAKTTETLQMLYDYVQDPTPDRGAAVTRLEEEADEIRRKLIDELNRSFVTPFDREDIFQLSRAVDDVADYAKSTVEEMTLFGIKTNEHIRRMAEGLHNASREIESALECILSHPNVCVQHLMKAKKLENWVEHRYREALVDLFKSSDVVEILKTREIYRHMSNAADRVDEAANVVSDIVVKMT